MRIKITLAPHRYPASIPANHHPLAAFIYETIETASPQFAEFLHDEGLRPGSAEETDRRFKFFVFGLPELPQYRFQGEEKLFEEGLVRWQIGSPLADFIEAFVAGLAMRDTVRLGRTPFSVVSAEVIPQPHFLDKMRFVALSPLMAATTDHDENGKRIKRYLRANDAGFGQLVVSNLLGKYRALTGSAIDNPQLRFEFDDDYIRRSGGYESRKVTRLIKYGSTEIKSVLAPFFVSGNPELIRLGWECGFGSGNSQGFGMAGV